MESHAGRGLGVGQERLPVQEEDRFGPLPQLVSDGPPSGDLSGLFEELRREIGPVSGERAGHGADPVAASATSVRGPRSLPGTESVPKPYCYF